MSSTNDSPALEQEADNQIELSLGLSIGRGLPKSTKFQNSMESVHNSSSELTNVPVIIPNEAGDSVTENLVGDLDGDNEVQAQGRREAKRMREEMLDEEPRRMFQGRVSETEIGVPESNLVKNSSVGSNDRKSSSLNGSNRNLGEQVTGRTACSSKDGNETVVISPAKKTSMISSDISQEADASKIETVNPIITGDENHTRQTNPLDTNKPREEQNSTSSGQVFKRPQMPYVSTTGNGPNGRRVAGFLYKYTNTEVCIVCVCHGSSFTPAEFVEHAGGINISHPLRHIIVTPSAFDVSTD